MQFSRIISFFMAFVAVGLVAAAPTEVEKRSPASSIMTVLTTLQTKTNTIIPKITAAGTNQAAMEEPLNELITALTAAQSGVSASGGLLGGLGLAKRQSADDIAVVFAGLTSEIVTALSPLTGVAIVLVPEVSFLLAEVDSLLNSVLFDVNILVGGVTVLVSGLLVDVSGILSGLSFTLIGTVLGLL